MKVILKQDVHGLGYTNDIVKVKNGYARNFLLPKGYAIVMTESSEKELNELLRQKAFKEEKVRKEAETMAKALESITLKIGAKAGTSGKIFGSVNAIQISHALKEQFNYDIDRKMIELDGDSIKELGNYKARIRILKNVETEISFEVISE